MMMDCMAAAQVGLRMGFHSSSHSVNRAWDARMLAIRLEETWDQDREIDAVALLEVARRATGPWGMWHCWHCMEGRDSAP